MPFNPANKLQTQLNESALFTPYLGLNVTLYDEKLGIWQGCTGYRDPKTLDSIGENQRFYTYSITKTFTAVAILMLVAQQKLSLDEVVQPHLPTINMPSSITLRQLLNHTAGLPNYTELTDYQPSVVTTPSAPWLSDRILELIQNTPLDFESGQGWHYSNTGYFVLKRLIETLTHKSYTEAIQTLIVNPLQLSQTFVADALPTKNKLTPGYSRELHPNQQMEDITSKYHPHWCYTGLIASSTADTVKFYRSLFLNKLIPDELLTQLRTPVPIGHSDPRFGNPGYGLGVMIDTASPYGTLIGHAGDGPGYSPWVMHLPNFYGRPLTMAIFGNTGSVGIPLRLAHDLLSHLKDL